MQILQSVQAHLMCSEFNHSKSTLADLSLRVGAFVSTISILRKQTMNKNKGSKQ